MRKLALVLLAGILFFSCSNEEKQKSVINFGNTFYSLIQHQKFDDIISMYYPEMIEVMGNDLIKVTLTAPNTIRGDVKKFEFVKIAGSNGFYTLTYKVLYANNKQVLEDLQILEKNDKLYIAKYDSKLTLEESL